MLPRRAAAIAAVGAFATATLAAEPAHADEWYGWQTLTSDAATLGLIVLAIKTSNGGTVPLAVASVGYVGVPIVIHAAHDQPAQAAASAGIRLGLPLVGGITGAILAGGSGDRYGIGALAGGMLGLVVGMVTASAIDAAVLARKDTD